MGIVDKYLIDQAQSHFMKGMYNEVCGFSHEVLNEMHKKNVHEVLFKVDFEKEYDNIN
jgi:hypothetical protein